MSKPRRSGIAEILESGRAPGFRVAGGTPRGGPTRLGYNPIAYDGSVVSPEQRIREDHENMAGIARQVADEKRNGRRGNVRLAGGCPISVWQQKMRMTGGDVSEVKRQLADEGFIDKTV